MISKKSYKALMTVFLGLCMICAAIPVEAKVSAAEAERLNKDLTPVGAIRAGNADGTIPAWEGGIRTIPKNVKYDESMGWNLPDPFPDDKILFTITAQNMEQYADKLSPGLKAFFKKNPDTFKMNVYQTRRTAAYPQWVYDNTYKNALEAELIGDGSDGFTHGAGGFPFPISTNGCEMQNNHVVRYRGKGHTTKSKSFTVYPDGSRVSGGEAIITYTFPYYRKTREEYFTNEDQGYSWKLFVTFNSPARRKGEILLGFARTNYSKDIAMAWQYLPGQRRVRRAPSIGYDTPNPSYMGLGCYDQSFVWASQPDRYDWKFNGRKEMFIPYNCYRIDLAPVEELDDILTPYHLNPKYVRWELHRVYEVEANLREGARHCYGKRVFFMDEDSWIIHLNDHYDTRGELWRWNMVMSKQFYQTPVNPEIYPYYGLTLYDFHDFQVDRYVQSGITQESEPSYEWDVPEDIMTLQHMRKVGRR